jgi:hypothetical protein
MLIFFSEITNSTLAAAAAVGDIMESPGHMEILASIISNEAFNGQVSKLSFRAPGNAQCAKPLRLMF